MTNEEAYRMGWKDAFSNADELLSYAVDYCAKDFAAKALLQAAQVDMIALSGKICIPRDIEGQPNV